MTGILKVNNVQHSIDSQEREDCFNERRSYGCEESYKKNRREWNENPAKHIVDRYPLHVDLELSSCCNLKCPMCYTITDEFKSKTKSGYMDFEIFKKIVDECAENDVYSIRLSLRGEPTLHKNFVDCIVYAKEKGIKEVSTLTNGKRFVDRDFCERVIKAGIDWITVSIDGIGNNYEKIRSPLKFDEIVTAMRNIMELRQIHGNVKPAVKIQGIWPAVKKNINEYLEIFTPLSDLIYVNPLIDFSSLSESTSAEYIPDFTCYQPFQRLIIYSNGKAAPCANDIVGEEHVGDAAVMSIYSIWNGERMNQFRNSHIEHTALSKYNICNNCQIPLSREDEEFDLNGRIIIIENYKGKANNSS
ncbi:MAG: radical SAM protein [Nitrospirae bacterium]|nr:radical SAM protein [Nitrospirota bacterium]